MDTQGLIDIISSFGFPIAACIGVAMYVKYIIDQYMKHVDKMQDRHTEEEKHMIEAINNNTLVIQRLCDKLGRDGNAI